MRICGLKTGALAYIPFSERFIFLRLYFVKGIRHCIFINVEQLDLGLLSICDQLFPYVVHGDKIQYWLHSSPSARFRDILKITET